MKYRRFHNRAVSATQRIFTIRTIEGSFDQIKSLFCVVYFLKYVRY
jgi:hypothetical protein